MGTIAAGVAAFGGGFVLGYEGYQVVTQFVEWLKANKLTSADGANSIFTSGGSYNFLTDGRQLFLSKTELYTNVTYSTQGGSAFWVNATRNESTSTVDYDWVFISSRNVVKHFTVKDKPYDAWALDGRQPCKMYDGFDYTTGNGYVRFYFPYMKTGYTSYELPFDELEQTGFWLDIFIPKADTSTEKREVTYTPPAAWNPPAPAPGQSVLYKPFPNAPDKGLEDIIADVPEAIASSNFKPAATTVIETPTPEPPPTPEVPPTVNPNPDVQAPEDVTPYTVKIGEVFPFCIPFDLYHMVTMFSAEPEAPNGKWEFYLPWEKQDPHPQLYKVEWDLSKFDTLAELCRKLELILFCVGLAVVTSKLIKW